MVVPAEILHVLHAGPLRDFLLRKCSRILVLDPDAIWFSETLQGVVLLLAEKGSATRKGRGEIAVVPLNGRDTLNGKAGEYFRHSPYIPGREMNGKWMLALLTKTERELLAGLESHQRVRRFGEIASVDVGIVTGANKFFLVPDSVVEEYGLQAWAHPMFGRSEHVSGVVYGRRNHEENRKKGLPTNFIWFGGQLFTGLSEGARKYIKLGERENLHRRYKCRIRTPWYAVPSVYASPVGMLKRSHHFPRLVLNRLKALTTDTAYRIQPETVSAGSLVQSFVNSLTALTAELEGRHYGGGVLELVPSEIEKLLLPLTDYSRHSLNALDQLIGSGTDPEGVLRQQDSIVLEPLGVSRADRSNLLEAWNRLRSRRQRPKGVPVPAESD